VSKIKKLDFELLDSIRGIAALYVAIAHCRGVLWMGGNEYLKLFPMNEWGVSDYLIVGSSMLTRLAVEFVIIFFVLSGFSIAHSLSSDKSPIRFYKRRLIRIYPSYVIALGWAGLVFIITKWIFPQWYDGTFTQFSFLRTVEMNTFFDPLNIIGNIFYMPMNGFISPLWSLTYEVIFYLLAPFILRHLKIYSAISIALFLLNFILPLQVSNFSLPFYIREFFFIYNFYFVVGILSYSFKEEIEKVLNLVSQSIFLLLIIFVLFCTLVINLHFQTETPYSFIAATFLGVLLMFYFLIYKTKIGWLVIIGKFSYTLYITHFASIYLYLAVFWLISGHSSLYISNYFVWMPAVIFVLIIAWAQYFFVEKKTKELLDLLRKA
jgi:peptidoglycan/LPS O-acetylase OafA/YrhL